MNAGNTRPACPDRKQLVALLQADAACEPDGMELHLESCPRCRTRLDELAGEESLWESVVSTLQADSREVAGAAGEVGGLPSAWPDRSPEVPALAGSPRTRPGGSSAPRVATARLFDPPVHPEMLGRLGRFDIESMIGRGGFGTVWKAWDTELNRPVAIKILAEHLAENATARRRFIREAQSAAAVNHPNVVPIHAVHGEAEIPWLVMGYIPGQSLEELVRRSGPLPAVAVVQMAMQIASGLAAAHQQGLVHRDVKPANILVEDDSTRALITDFGLARAADDASVTQTGWLAGTPHYMSPEQAQGRDIDARSDLFSMGSVLYFLATGRQAFRAGQTLAVLQQIANSTPIPPRNVNADVPSTLSRIILRLLEKDPRDRFRSAGAVCEVLQQYLAHLQHPQSRPRPRLNWAARVWRKIAVGSLAAAVAAIALAIWIAPLLRTAITHSRPGPFAPALAAELPDSGTVELTHTWPRYRSELLQLENELGEGLPPGYQPAAPGDGLVPSGFLQAIADLERQIETLERGPFLAVPRTANPNQPDSDPPPPPLSGNRESGGDD